MIYDEVKNDRIYTRESLELNAYVLKNEIVKRGDGMTHQIQFKYNIHHKNHYDFYYTNDSMSKLQSGDSLLVRVDIFSPSSNQVIGYYHSLNDQVEKVIC